MQNLLFVRFFCFIFAPVEITPYLGSDPITDSRGAAAVFARPYDKVRFHGIGGSTPSLGKWLLILTLLFEGVPHCFLENPIFRLPITKPIPIRQLHQPPTPTPRRPSPPLRKSLLNPTLINQLPRLQQLLLPLLIPPTSSLGKRHSVVAV